MCGVCLYGGGDGDGDEEQNTFLHLVQSAQHCIKYDVYVQHYFAKCIFKRGICAGETQPTTVSLPSLGR